ncbi:MAG TPA: hypothetical protein VGR53_02965 [Nitrososphaerales archaeon]|nr:hypothetical protein [Nitrososphaerales archaeon]
MKKSLTIYDDTEQLARKYKSQLEDLKAVDSQFDVMYIENERLQRELSILNDRRSESRDGARAHRENSIFDETDVLLVDIDLVQSNNPFLTGDRIAYLVRCFSKCGIIVGLSKFRKVDFDLTLREQPSSFVDLGIKSDQVANPGLWANSWSGFRPWVWPVIPQMLNSFRKNEDLVRRNMSAPVVSSIGLESVASSLPSSALDFLGSDALHATFQEFVTQSEYGFRDGDKPLDQNAAARVAAARISKCLETLVLPGQEVLVDAPHLVSRYPSLLSGDPGRKTSWNKTAKFLSRTQLGLNHRKIERFRLKTETWVSRPVWLWPELSNNQEIDEVDKPWKSRENQFVFCEDASAFFRLSECKEFTASVESYYVHRYIKKFSVFRYAPAVTLLQAG